MNREEIKSYLPHREPMLLVDEAFSDGDGKSVGRYTVRGDEFFLQGHFPGNPVVPGVILCEMMAQSSCVIMLDKLNGKITFFTSMDKVKFKKPVTVGDTIEFHCELTGAKGPFCFMKGAGYVGGKLCVSGEVSFALTERVETGEQI